MLEVSPCALRRRDTRWEKEVSSGSNEPDIHSPTHPGRCASTTWGIYVFKKKKTIPRIAGIEPAWLTQRPLHEQESHSTPRAISSGRAERLGRSLAAYTPALSTGYFAPALARGEFLFLKNSMPRNGRLFSGAASSLDAFSSYPQRRGCSAVPCRTTDKLEAATPSSSRTMDILPSGDQHFQ